MSGHAAMLGFNFQNAHAVLDLFKMLLNPVASYARVEGIGDELDFELYGIDGSLLVGKQLKTRAVNRTWSAKEILDEVKRWSSSASASGSTQFEFVTNGRLGDSALALVKAVEKPDLRIGHLADELQVLVASNWETLQRTKLVTISGDIEALIDKCVRIASKILTDSSSAEHAASRAEFVVNELFKIVALKSGRSEPAKRVIKVSEVQALLGHSVAVDLVDTWNNDIFEAAISSVRNKTLYAASLEASIGLPEGVSSGKDESSGGMLIRHVMDGKVAIFYGPSGSGKTTYLDQLSQEAAEEETLLLGVDAYEYNKGRLSQLVANALNSLHSCGAFAATGSAVLQDPRVVIAIDNASEIQQELRGALGEEVRELLAMSTHCGLVVSGRSLVAMQGLVPPTKDFVSFSLKDLSVAKQVEVLDSWGAEFQNIDRRRLIEYGGPGTKTPMFLRVAAEAAKLDQLSPIPAVNYENFIIYRGEAIGIEEASTHLAVASELLYTLWPEHRRRIPGLKFRQLSRHICERFSVSVLTFENFLFRSGLFVRQRGDKIAPFHDSLIDFLIAKAITFDQERVGAVKGGEHLVFEFLTQFGIFSTQVTDSLVSEAPYVLPRIARWEDANDKPLDLEFVSYAMGALLPPTIDCCIQNYGNVVGYIQITFKETVQIGVANSFPVAVPDSPIFMAVEGRENWLISSIWRLFLKENVEPSPKGYVRRPESSQEYRELLISYADKLEFSVEDLIHNVFPQSMQLQLTNELAPYRYQFCDTTMNGDDRSPWATAYILRKEQVSRRFLAPQDFLKQRNHGAVSWGSGTRDAFTSTTPERAAAKIVSQTFTRLVGHSWL